MQRNREVSIEPGDAVLASNADVGTFTCSSAAGKSTLIGLSRRELLPLLKDPKSDWPDRFLVTHVGRWAKGQAEQSKYAKCSIRDRRFTLVDNTELYDLEADPGETKNVLDQHPADFVAKRERPWQLLRPMAF